MRGYNACWMVMTNHLGLILCKCSALWGRGRDNALDIIDIVLSA